MTEYIKKHYRLILMSVFAALVCFGYQAFNSNIRIDTEELINHPGSTLGWLTIGRFGLVLLKRMLGLGVYRTIKSGILMLLFFILGGNVLTYGCYYFSGKKDGKPYWIFTLLYMTSNIWSFQFYFSLQQAEVAFAMLLMAVTGFFMCDLCFCEKYKENRSGKDLCKLFLSTVFIVLACSFMTGSQVSEMLNFSDGKYKELNMIPNMVTLEQFYQTLFRKPEYLLKFWNSVVCTFPTVIGQVALSLTASIELISSLYGVL